MSFADISEREEALKYGKVYDIDGSPPYTDVPTNKRYLYHTSAQWFGISLFGVLMLLAVILAIVNS